MRARFEKREVCPSVSQSYSHPEYRFSGDDAGLSQHPAQNRQQGSDSSEAGNRR